MKLTRLMSVSVLIFAVLMAVNAEAKAAQKAVIDVVVAEEGFQPKEIKVPPGSDVVLKITRKTKTTCSKEIVVPAKKIKVKLPLNKTVTVALGTVTKGEIQFGCGMDMMDGGKILVE